MGRGKAVKMQRVGKTICSFGTLLIRIHREESLVWFLPVWLLFPFQSFSLLFFLSRFISFSILFFSSPPPSLFLTSLLRRSVTFTPTALHWGGHFLEDGRDAAVMLIGSCKAKEGPVEEGKPNIDCMPGSYSSCHLYLCSRCSTRKINPVNHNNKQNRMITLKVRYWHTYLGGNHQLSIWN